ncbi:MAG: S-layer homology domain-containing protein [Micrococcus sp.]|nr:S-layer homology domain-containing protein [Micrococcus sp.]
MTHVTPTASTAPARRTKPLTRALSRPLAGAVVALTLTGATAATAPPATAAPAAPVTVPAAPVTACSTPDFTDARPGSSFYTAITWMRCEGITAGYTDNTFRKGRQITRGETAQFLYRLSGDTHKPSATSAFTDVNPGGAGFEAISWMHAKGYTSGYGNGAFGFNDPITRGQLASFLHGMSGEAGYTAPGTSPFTDMEPSSAFYRASAWLEDTQLVGGYTDGTFRPGQAVTRGEAARFMYAMETRTHGAPPAYQASTPVHSSGANATGGSGGTYRDALGITYSNGTVSSQYHLYADHLDGSAPHGIMIHLHGDGGWEYKDQKWSFIPDYVELAEQHDLMLVVPHTPDRSTNTWWRKDSSSQWAADLLQDLGTKYDLDLNQVYWTGYSGGADTVAEHMMNSHSAGWTGGAAVIVAGGGVYGQDKPLRPISDALKKNFQMHWVVGADDTPAAGGASGDYDAVRAARLGHKFYTDQGLQTSLTIKPGMDHWEISPSGPEKLAQVLAGR